MKTHLSKRIVAFLLTLAMVLSLMPMVFAEEENLTGKTVILHTNDTHGALMGFAQVAKVKADYEAKGANVILVDAGDYSQGTIYVSTNKGEAAITMLNEAGYDFATLGNHEFDFGYAQLKANMEKAQFQPLVADVLLKETGKSIFNGHAIKEVGGVKIGIFGMETPETFTKVNPGLIQEITFPQGEEMYACAQAEVDALKAEGADLVIGLVHLGVDAESEPNRSVDLYEHVTGIDFLIDGHSHTVMTEGPNGEPIQSTGTKASDKALMNVGMIQIDNATKKIEKNELISLGEDAPVDEAVAAKAQAIMDEVDAVYNAKFAESQVELNGDKAPGNRTEETNLGDLITDAMLWSVVKAGGLTVDNDHVVAITNGGGIRAWIHAGDVTMKDVNTVLPFGNTVSVVYVTGAELLEALEASTYSTPGAVGGFPQVAGMKFNIDVSKSFVKGNQYPESTYYGPAGIVRVSIDEIGGKPFDPEATYAVVTNNFCAAGGDTYYVFKNASAQFDTGLPLDEVLMDYITEELHGVIGETYAAPKGRITQEERPGELDGKTVILHTNDTHGALLGFAQVATVKKLYEAMGATVILMDAGDYSQGTTYVSTNKGEAAVTVMNAAGYDYVTLGNHEFDFGYAQLKANMEQAEFQLLCADVLLKENGQSAFTPYAVETVNGMKIGIFGMETPETFTKVNPGLIQEITFPQGELLYDCAQAQVDALKNTEHADLIIGLVHLGVDAESEPNRSVDLYEHVTGIDFLIDGHSHTVMTEGPNGEPIQSTGTKASKTALMNVGAIVIDNATKTIVDNYLIPLGEDAPVDETVAEKAKEIMDAVDAEYGAKFAESSVELNGDKAPGNRNMETNLGDLITDSMRWGVLKDMDAETLGVPEENVVAITNGGGIRAWIHAGDVTKNDVNTVLPFGNTVAVVYVKGNELLEALEASTYSTPGAVGGFPQVSGMKFDINTRVPFDKGEQYPDSTYFKPASVQRVTIKEVNGKAFDPNATYAVVTNNFCAAGGDTYYAFKAASAQFDTGLPMDEVLIDYINTELHGVIGETYAEPQGRITQPFLFDDVKDSSAWYFEHVYWAYDNGVTSGMDETHFGPDNECTRAQVVTFLYAAAGRPEFELPEESFSDVAEGDWYYTPVMWALSEGITAGMDDGSFGANLTCTRAQIVTFLYAAAGKPADFEMPSDSFTDVPEGEWFYTPVMWALSKGITAGMGDGSFGAASTCTRAQIVTFLHAFVNKTSEDKAVSFPSTSNDDIAKYGNVYLNVNVTELNEMGFAFGDIVTVSFLDKSLDVPFVPTFSYVDQGTAGLFKDSKSDRALMAINMGDFATTYGLATKTVNEDKTYYWTACEGVAFPVPVTIEMKEQGGYATEMAIRDINRTNNREDYPNLTDAEFANFRQITTTGMGDHLYRGSSPINPELGRNTYADAALKDAKVTVIMNLANDAATAEAYEGFADTYYAGQRIIYLNLGVDFQADDFQAGLANGLRCFAENKGVYYVHCTEGKDRAGFVSALLECLMGASYDEVVADYLKTYENYYTVVDGAQQPLSEETLAAIANSNIIKTLKTAFGVEDLQTADLAAEAEEYVASIGLTADEIAALKANLAGEYTENVSFEFLVTSDLHGQIYATDYTAPYAQSGTYKRGLTRIATYIKEQKAAYGDNVYTVDMGDTFQGAPLTYYYAFNKPEAKDPAILAFRTIGYDMWLVGNHEFNYGLEILNRQMDYAVSESTETEQQLTMCMANYLKAETNNDETKDWACWRDNAPYVIKDFDGFKVAVIGFGNPNIPTWDVPANWEGIYFANIIETYQHYEAEMLEQADMIVVVAHSGIGSDEDSDFMERLVNATNTISFAFSGHEHGNQVKMIKNADGKDIPVLQPYTKARAIAQVQVEKVGDEITVTPKIVNMENYAIDEDLAELLKPYETDTWENYMLQPIGTAKGDYPAADLGTKPSAFMDLINTVQIWGAYDRTGLNTPDKTSDDTPAMLSISAPLTSGNNANLISAGPIYLGDMFGLYRFENWFYQITMSGEEVKEWLEFAATKIQVDAEGNPYVTSGDLTYYDVIMGEGFHYDIDVSRAEDDRVINMTYNGQPVLADQQFTVVVNNYRYNGGGNYVMWLNNHGCEFVANDPDRIIYSTQFDMLQGEDEGQARALLVSYIKEQTAANGGIEPFISSDWTVQNGFELVNPYYAKVTDASTLQAGDKIIFVSENDNVACAAMGTEKFFTTATAFIDSNGYLYADDAIQITLGGTAGAWTLTTSEGQIGATAAKSLNHTGSGTTEWTIEIDADGNATVTVGSFGRILYNVNSPRFMNYTSNTNASMVLPQIYKYVEG